MADWKELKRCILERLDIRAEYARLGVQFPEGAKQFSSGWLPCFAHGRGENKPSAGINVAGQYPMLGRYKEFVGDGRSMNLFDFAASIGQFSSWMDAAKHYAKQVDVAIPRGRPEKHHEDNLTFKEWNDSLVRNWCDKKKPIDARVVKASGARLATWPKKTNRYTVIAFPVYGEHLLDDDPTGTVIVHQGGLELPVSQGKDQQPIKSKSLTCSGSKSGWVGRFGLTILKKAEYVWKLEGIPDVLALQTAIIRAKETCPECMGNVVEGMKCPTCNGRGVIYPHLHKHAILTNSGGCQETPTDLYLQHLNGKKVIVIGDADKDGQKGAAKWADAITPVAEWCRNPQLPYQIEPKHGKDVRDYLQEHTFQDIFDLAMLAEPWTPGTKITLPGERVSSAPAPLRDEQELAYERSLCAMFGIDVLGEDEELRVEVFTEHHGKTTVLRDVDHLTYFKMLQMCGPIAREKINNGNEEIPGMYHMTQIKQSISMLAGYERNSGRLKCGLGCWQSVDEVKEPLDGVVLVGGREAAEWNESRKTFARIRKPRHGGMLLDLSNETDSVWYDAELLGKYLADYTPEWAKSVINDTVKLFSNWNWKHNDVSPVVITGLILASWVQTLWYWRPLVSVTGPSDSGKSTLLETLDAIFGDLSLKSSKSSEAGIRQALRNDAKVLLCDEFESDSHRQKILDLLRTSSKGDQMLRGNSTQDGQRFGLKHIAWVAAIEVGLKREPDRNRFIQLDLKRPRTGDDAVDADTTKHRRGELDWLPKPWQLRELGMKLLAISIRNIGKARVLADKLRSYEYPGVHGRIIESYSVPVSMLAAIQGNTDEVAQNIMKLIVGGIDFEGGSAADEQELLDEILSSLVDLGSGQRPSVSQVLTRPDDYTSPWTGLEKSGVGIVYEGHVRRDRANEQKDKYLFIAHSIVKRQLLGGTDWADQSIDQILKRLPGAVLGRNRLAGKLVRGVRVPWKYLDDTFLKGADGRASDAKPEPGADQLRIFG